MANITTFTVSGFFNQQEFVTEVTSVTSSSGAGLSSSNRAELDEGDTVTYTWNGSSGSVTITGVNSSLFTMSPSNGVLSNGNNVTLTAINGASAGTDNVSFSANFTTYTQYLEHLGSVVLSGTLTPSTIATTESQGGTTVTSNINTGGFYYWDLERNSGEPSGSNSFGFNGPTLGSFSAAANTNVNITTGPPNQSAGSTSNIGYQGVGFTIDTFTGPSRTGTKIATSNWTIYEDITGTSVSPSSQTLADTTTTFSVNVTTNWRGSDSVALRIRNVTTNTVVDTFSTSNGSTTLSRTGIAAPAATGVANTYRVEANNGNSYLTNGPTFTVTRNAPPDNTPEGFTALGGNKTNATPNTTFYATFSGTTVAPGLPADAPGLSLGSTIDNGTSISVSNGEWSINKTTWNTSTSTVNAGQVVYFRGTSASSGGRTHSLTIGTVTRSFTTNTSSGSITVSAEYDTENSFWSVNLSSGTGDGSTPAQARQLTSGTTVTFNNVGFGVGADIDFASFNEWTNNTAQNNVTPGSSFTKTWASGVLGNTLDAITLTADVAGSPQTIVYFRQPPVPPDPNVSPSNTTMAYNAGSVNVSVSGVTSGEVYEVHENNNATSLGSATASGTSVTIPATIGNAEANTTGNLAIGEEKTYEIYSRRPTAIGGDNLPDQTNDIFTIERLVEPLTNVTDITFSPASTASSTTSVTVNATGGSGGTIQVRQGTSGSWSNAPAAFSLTRGTPYTFQARRLGAQSANSTTPIQENYTPPYLLPDRDITFSRSPSGNIAATYSGNVIVSVANGTANNRYRVLRTTNGNLGCGNTGLITGTTGTITLGDAANELPSAALTDQTFSYTLQARRGESSGGDDTTWYTVTSNPSTFTITRDALDDDPDQFTFTDVSDVARNTTQTSNQITIGGIDTTVNVSVSSGSTYSKNGNAYTSSAGTAVNGDTFRVRHTSSSSLNTAVNTTLTVGTTSDTFTTTTVAAEAPTVSSVTFNNPSSPNVTATVNLSNSGAGGTLQYACGLSSNPTNWQSSNTFTISRGSSGTVYARARRSSTTVSNQVTASRPGFLLPDDEVSGTSSTIAFVATSATTTVSNVARSTDTVAVRLNNGSTNIATRNGDGDITFSSNLPSGGSTTTYELFTRRATSTGGDGSTFYATNDTFTVERTAQDTNPNGLNFTDVTNVALNTTQTSNEVTISSITGTVDVSVSGGSTYSKNSGAYTSSDGSAVSGDKFRVRHTSSGSFSTDVTTTLTVGSGSGDFTSTTLAADTTPNSFTFTDLSNVARNTTQTSNQITVSGLNTSTSVSVSGGSTYSKNGNPYTSSAGTAVNGDTFRVRHTSSGSFSTNVNTTLNIGGVTDTFTSTTLAEDTTPGAFTFSDVSGVAPSTTQTSNQITISGINSTANVSVTGGTYRKNGTGGFVSSTGTAVNGDDFEVRHTSSGSPLTNENTTLTVGGVSDTFTSTTRDITAPIANNVTVNNPESATYTATFNLSNVGQDGTLQYAIEKNDSSPDNWTNAATDSTSTFTANFSRTSSPGTIYAQARRSASKTSSIVSVAGRGFLAPANITCSNQNIATTFTGTLSVAISGGISTKEAYAVSLSTGLSSANVAGNSIDVIDPYNGSSFDIPSGNLPSNGNTTTYYLYSRRLTTYGGSGNYSEVGSFTVQRATAVATPTGFTVTDVVGNNGTYTSSTSTTNNLAADSLAGHTLQFRVDSGSWTTSSSFTHNYGVQRVYEARYLRNSDSEFSATPASITRRVADAEITLSPVVTSILSTNTTNELKIADIIGATALTQYRVRATGNINGSSVTNQFINAPTATNSTPDLFAANPGELPAAGTSATYTVMARVATGNNGDNNYRFLRTGIANRSWTLTRTSPGTSPDQFSFSAPTTNDDNISVTVTASYSGSTPAGTIQLSETSNFSSTQANGSGFAFVRGTPKTIYARLSNAGEFSSPSSESHTPAYLTPQLNIAAPTGFDSNLNFTQAGEETVSIVAGNLAGNNYRVRRTSPSVVQCGNTGSLGASATGTVTIGNAANELPQSGEIFSYDVQGQKSVATGGDGTSWAATSPLRTFSIGRQNNWNFASVSSATGNVTYNASAQVNGLVGTLTVTRSGSGTFAVSSSATTPGSGFSTASKSITNGQYIHARITASSTPGTTLTQTFTIDGQSSGFGVTTPLSGGGGGADYGLRIFNENQNLVLDTADRTGQVAYQATITASGGASYNSVTTTTTNLPTSFNTEGVTSDSEIVIITGDSRTKAFLQDNGASSPKWSIKTVRQGTGNTTVTVIVVHLGDTG